MNTSVLYLAFMIHGMYELHFSILCKIWAGKKKKKDLETGEADLNTTLLKRGN